MLERRIVPSGLISTLAISRPPSETAAIARSRSCFLKLRRVRRDGGSIVGGGSGNFRIERIMSCSSKKEMILNNRQHNSLRNKF